MNGILDGKWTYRTLRHNLVVLKDGQAQRGPELATPWSPPGLSAANAGLNGKVSGTLTFEPAVVLPTWGKITQATVKVGNLLESYRYDVFGQPFLRTRNSDQIVDQSISSLAVTRLLLAYGQLYDLGTNFTAVGSFSYDSRTGQPVSVNQQAGPWTGGNDSQSASGGMSGPGGVSIPGKDPDTGGLSPAGLGRELVKVGSWLFDPSDDTWMWDPSGAIDVLVHVGEHKALEGLAHKLGIGFLGGLVLGFTVGLEDDNGGRSVGAQENANHSGHKKGSLGGGSPGSARNPRGRPEDAEPPNPQDRGGKRDDDQPPPNKSEDEGTVTTPEPDDHYEFEKNHDENDDRDDGTWKPGKESGLPDYDGSGGGRPNTIGDATRGGNLTQQPDYDGSGGGTPNTISGAGNRLDQHLLY